MAVVPRCTPLQQVGGTVTMRRFPHTHRDHTALTFLSRHLPCTPSRLRQIRNYSHLSRVFLIISPLFLNHCEFQQKSGSLFGLFRSLITAKIAVLELQRALEIDGKSRSSADPNGQRCSWLCVWVRKRKRVNTPVCEVKSASEQSFLEDFTKVQQNGGKLFPSHHCKWNSAFPERLVRRVKGDTSETCARTLKHTHFNKHTRVLLCRLLWSEVVLSGDSGESSDSLETNSTVSIYFEGLFLLAGDDSCKKKKRQQRVYV